MRRTPTPITATVTTTIIVTKDTTATVTTIATMTTTTAIVTMAVMPTTAATTTTETLLGGSIHPQMTRAEARRALMAAAAACSGHEEAVHFLQLLLGEDEAMHLFLSTSARDGHPSYEHGPALLLLLGLGNHIIDVYTLEWVLL
ncbi:hypothetical protein EYF80_039301 [Liparis tanakae]|uniref:Uncharacterized protein n=1 Tax=Liparis tanakae TaxID=230148 RepID=A0A4Z2GBA5_9TELE|nr:hypothetical protein EYF80_039301 [Liparis tanakae]